MNLLVPMDMDETSKHALQEAITLAKSFKEQGKSQFYTLSIEKLLLMLLKQRLT